MRRRVTLLRYRRLADFTVGALLLIIASGAVVRLTGSGLGCPDWPKCNGQVIPELDYHTAVEFGNRLISAFIGIPLLMLLVGAYWLTPRRRDLLRPAQGVFALLLVQGGLGGLAVRLDLTWLSVVAHYLMALVILTFVAVIASRARREEATPLAAHDARLVYAVRALAIYGGLVIVLGTLATAAGPHSGGAGTGDVVQRLQWFGVDTLGRVIRTHGHLSAVLGIATVALWFFALRSGASRGLRRSLTVAALLMAAQGAAGLIQYHAGLPAGVVWFHASAAAALWLALVWAVLEAGRAAPQAAAATPPTRSASVRHAPL